MAAMATIYAGDRIPRLLTPDEVAEVLAISPRGVLRLAERGELRAIRVGERRLRVAPDDLRAYIESRREAA
jgi:excisionase family DNA binding protein